MGLSLMLDHTKDNYGNKRNNKYTDIKIINTEAWIERNLMIWDPMDGWVFLDRRLLM